MTDNPDPWAAFPVVDGPQSPPPQDEWDAFPLAQQETVIATTQDGGRVIERNGQRSFVSSGYSTSDPATIDRILAGEGAGQIYRRGVQEDIVQDRPIAARAATAFTGVPFAREWGDEAASAMFGPQAGQAWRASVDAMQETRPGQSLALQAGGAVAGSVPLGLAATGSGLAQGATRGVRMMTTGLAGAVAGAAEGAIGGAGDQSGSGRGANAATQTFVGGALGGAVGTAIPLADDALRAVIERASRGRNTQQFANELGISVAAASVVRNAVERGDMAAARQALTRQGSEAMLADAGQAGRELLDASAAAGGEAGAIARQSVDGRVNQRYGELTETLDTVLGTPQGRDTAREALRTGTAAERSAIYETAYSQPIDYSARSGRQIEALLRRVEPSVINAAERLMRTEGVESAQIMARIGDDGRVVFEQMPDVRQLHYIMRGLDEVANREQGAGALGGTSAQGRAFGNLRRQLRDAVSSAVPEFGEAQSRFAEIARQSEAIETGYTLLRPATTRETARRALDGASEAEMAAARQGLRSYIDDQVAQVTRIASDPNQDAREALRVMRLMTSEQSQANVRLILGRNEAENLFQSLDQTIGALELRAAIAANSRTAIRGSIQDTVREVAAPGVIETLVSDVQPVEAGRRVIRMLTGNSEEARALREVGVFEEISRALTQTRGPQARRALRILEEAQQNGGFVSDGRAEYLGRVLSRTFAIQGHQAGTQVLTGR
jgi:hypothetical protein